MFWFQFSKGDRVGQHERAYSYSIFICLPIAFSTPLRLSFGSSLLQHQAQPWTQQLPLALQHLSYLWRAFPLRSSTRHGGQSHCETHRFVYFDYYYYFCYFEIWAELASRRSLFSFVVLCLVFAPVATLLPPRQIQNLMYALSCGDMALATSQFFTFDYVHGMIYSSFFFW